MFYYRQNQYSYYPSFNSGHPYEFYNNALSLQCFNDYTRRNHLLYCGHRNPYQKINYCLPPTYSSFITYPTSQYLHYTNPVINKNFRYRFKTEGRDPGWENAKLMAASGQFVYLVRNGDLIKMNGNTLTPEGRDAGWERATLMAASGEYIYLVRNGELIKMNANTLRPEGRDTGWERATLMAASGDFVYLVRNGELIKMNANTLRPEGRDSGWENATLMSASSNFVYLVRDGVLIKLNANTLRPEGRDMGWEKATLIAASEQFVYLVRNGVLIKMDVNTLTPLDQDTGWENATLMTASGYFVYLVRNGELIKMNASNGSNVPQTSSPQTNSDILDQVFIPFEFPIWGPFYGKGKVYRNRVEVDGYVEPGIRLSHEEVKLDGSVIRTSSQDKTTGYKMEASFWVVGKTLYANFRAFIPRRCVLGYCTEEKELYKSGDKEIFKW